jgi:threonine/homoserine/homoserine lactone efflux protein
LALIATPGQDNVYILTRGVAQGKRAALVSAWG